VSIYPITCYIARCDECRLAYDETGDGYVAHFADRDNALAVITDVGWSVDVNGTIVCPRCFCRRRGHDYSPWIVCFCNGSVIEHALNGCGFYRDCRHNGCDFYEFATLAELPTIDEPAAPGC
jgi:hypothetical protein